MVSTLAVIALIGVVVIGVWFIYRLNPQGVSRTVSTVEKARWAFGLVFLGLAAYHFLLSGNALYVAIALAGFAFLTAYALVERPWREVI